MQVRDQFARVSVCPSMGALVSEDHGLHTVFGARPGALIPIIVNNYARAIFIFSCLFIIPWPHLRVLIHRNGRQRCT